MRYGLATYTKRLIRARRMQREARKAFCSEHSKGVYFYFFTTYDTLTI